MKAIFLLLFGTAAFAAWAEPMTFMAGGYDGRCELCGGFIQASGEITEDTPRRFEAFVQQVGNPGLIRLNSPGGSLRAGIELGEKLRALRFATEVGSDEADPKGLGYPAFGDRKSNRVPGTCASACAYAFLGGVKRTIEGGSKLGVQGCIASIGRIRSRSPQSNCSRVKIWTTHNGLLQRWFYTHRGWALMAFSSA